MNKQLPRNDCISLIAVECKLQKVVFYMLLNSIKVLLKFCNRTAFEVNKCSTH